MRIALRQGLRIMLARVLREGRTNVDVGQAGDWFGVRNMSQPNTRPVIVTGGASGIGRAIVDRLMAEGYPVGVFDINQPGLTELAATHGDALRTYCVDISDYDAVAAAVDQFEQDTSPVYGLVNNAGWDEARVFLDTDPEFWRKIIDLNLYGPLNMTHCVLSQLKAQGAGRVINIASDAGRVGSSGEAVYSAAKGGTIALMKTLAREHARHGITFNSICPGPTDTPLLAGFDDSGKLLEALKRAIPLKRLAEPADFPGLVVYFLSDESSFVTGQTISISGGLSMHG